MNSQGHCGRMLFNWRACDLNGNGTNLLSTLEGSCINFFSTLTARETLKSVCGGPSIPALTLFQSAPFHTFPGSSTSSLPLKVEERQEPPYPPLQAMKRLGPLILWGVTFTTFITHSRFCSVFVISAAAFSITHFQGILLAGYSKSFPPCATTVSFIISGFYLQAVKLTQTPCYPLWDY